MRKAEKDNENHQSENSPDCKVDPAHAISVLKKNTEEKRNIIGQLPYLIRTMKKTAKSPVQR
jgi:hypothetical protein